MPQSAGAKSKLQQALSEDQQFLLGEIKSDPLYWFRNWTRTFDQHWYDAGLKSPYNPLPNFIYFDHLFDFLKPEPKLFETQNRKIRLIVKSRDLMVSWSVIAAKTHKAMVLPRQEILLQSQTEEKGYELIFYAKTLWEQMPPWLQREFPLKKGMRLEDFPKDRIEFGNGSRIMALAQGDTKINSYHPTDLVQDEAALQAEGRSSYGAALPACQNITCLSSAYPGWYEDIVEPDYHPSDTPDSFSNPATGVYLRHTSKGIPVMWLKYTSDPARTDEWVKREKPNYLYDSDWEREQEMRFNAGGGELVLASLLRERKDEIVISEPGYKANPNSNFYAGFDWGEANPTSFHIYEVKRTGEIYAILEHYVSGPSATLHGDIICGIRIPLADGTYPLAIDVVKGIYADPSIFWDMQQQESGGYKATVDLFPERMRRKMQKGQRGQDNTVKDRIRQMWGDSLKDQPKGPVKFKIVSQGGIPARKVEGTFDYGCPNLLWEIMRLRRAELGASQLMTKNPTEKLVQKHNHAFDDFCYFLTGALTVPVKSKEEKWAERRDQLREKNPEMNVDSLIIYQKQFEREYQRTEAQRSWR